ncbi:hypothetical protein TraAM80_04503 [Trypanosoma rangeli]|uniref:Vacuolar protein sorting-associated protein VTA1 n=1 Tax=Trypanosoma rangeli TaxID=5698 RepID=A0A422NJH4_TRYRA|nr:uncharacterized protein TraAM80_04503 [Trypanosoma rangeli]RNF05564.1 hypothetical protein TraAM80_04503 [Trypanosoma rangeli]|eukprot:RNF05564.1 hypothetical protein TraAM80_04503 [Trypanosoma rangeli]
MSSSLTESVPQHWVATLRPYLQRADEFDKLQPAIAYFLRTHVAHLAMRQRRKEDHAGTQYLRQLLEALESDKQRLGPGVTEADGRTLLTKMALTLFTRADDAERSGAPADMGLVRLFFTTSILLDATAQFTENGELDPIAAKRRDYARYIAVRMKKALESGVPYESPNAAGMSEGRDDAATDDTSDDREAQQQQPLFPTAAQQPVMGFGDPPPPPPPPPPPYKPSSPLPQPVPAVPMMAPGNSIGTGGPSMDAIISAQKCAKQAVSALQFYDHVTARKQLISALKFIDGS